MIFNFRLTLHFSLVLILPSFGLGARFSTDIVATSGDPAPGGNGQFGIYGSEGVVLAPFALNDDGQVVFFGRLSETTGGDNDDTGLFLGDSANLSQIFREGQAVPGGNGFFLELPYYPEFPFAPPLLNELGQAIFIAPITHGGDTEQRGIFRGDGQTLIPVALPGQAVPGGGSLEYAWAPRCNDVGQMVFSARLDNSGGGVFRSDGLTLVQIARQGQIPPDGNGTLGDVSDATMNNVGQAAFIGRVFHPGPDINFDRGLFRGDGGTLAQIARRDQPVPAGNEKFDGFFDFSLNDIGQVAFVGTFYGPNVGFNNTGVFRGDGETILPIVREGQTVPDGNGNFETPLRVDINRSGQITFTANVINTSGGMIDNFGIFRHDGHSLMQIFRKGQPTPDSDGTFGDLYQFAVNDRSQVAIFASVLNHGVGVFLFDDVLGWITIARAGDSLLESEIITAAFAHRGMLNELGQVAYTFDLENGRSGIAVTTPPDPADLTPGDTDFDGDIDLADLGTLATYYGESDGVFGWVNGDFDNDNDVDLNDLGALATNYGGGSDQAYTDFQALTSVPEPAWSVLGLAGLGVIRRRRR